MVVKYIAAVTLKVNRKKLIDLLKANEAQLTNLCWVWNGKSCEVRFEGTATVVQAMYNELETIMGVT